MGASMFSTPFVVRYLTTNGVGTAARRTVWDYCETNVVNYCEW
jgi:hypothetical protein